MLFIIAMILAIIVIKLPLLVCMWLLWHNIAIVIIEYYKYCSCYCYHYYDHYY